jgi:hypothetical protein
MANTSGMKTIGDYATPATNKLKAQALLDLIPNSDTASSSGAVAGGTNGAKNTHLDEMSPAAATQLRVELAALVAALVNV